MWVRCLRQGSKGSDKGPVQLHERRAATSIAAFRSHLVSICLLQPPVLTPLTRTSQPVMFPFLSPHGYVCSWYEFLERPLRLSRIRQSLENIRFSSLLTVFRGACQSPLCARGFYRLVAFYQQYSWDGLSGSTGVPRVPGS